MDKGEQVLPYHVTVMLCGHVIAFFTSDNVHRDAVKKLGQLEAAEVVVLVLAFPVLRQKTHLQGTCRST